MSHQPDNGHQPAKSHDNQLWYIRQKGKIKGPFTTGLISKQILLGRVHSSDMLSQDKQTWRKASSIREVMPEVLKYRNEANYKERLKAARRWADERGEVREVDKDGNELLYQPRKKITHLKIKTVSMLGLLSLSGIVAAFIYAIFVFTPDAPLAMIDCNAKGQDGSIFDGCHLQRRDFGNLSLKNSSFKNTLLQSSRFSHSDLQGSAFDYANLSLSDLNHANFTKASLRAADLRGADLNGTDFSRADLSYADLTHAKGSGVKLVGARLGNAIWFDGKVCAKESIGRCFKR